MSDRVIADRPASAHDSDWQLDRIVGELHAAWADWCVHNGHTEVTSRELPSREAVRQILEALHGALSLMRPDPTDLREESEDFYVGHTLDSAPNTLVAQVRLELHRTVRQARVVDRDPDTEAVRLAYDFAAVLPALRRLLDTNVLVAYHGDPATCSVDKVLLYYPDILAVIHHHVAHRLYRTSPPLLARIVAETVHVDTGIDIHPGAQIGSGFFTGHGTGVVIGETAVIGEHVWIYQAMTLGTKRFPADADGHLEKSAARHPMVKDDIVIYAGATILGHIVIGRSSSIDDDVWFTRSIPPGSSVTQANVQSGVQKGVQSPRPHTYSHNEVHPVH